MRKPGRVSALLIAAGAAGLLTSQVALGGAPARAATATAQPGTAAAGANVLGIAPGVSGLSLTTTFGESNAAYQGTESQAKSATIDLGSLGLVLSSSTFCGQPELPAKDQPQPLTADSEQGPHSRSAAGTAGVGGQSVVATASPEKASSTTTPVEEKLPGIFDVAGTSSATVHYDTSTGQAASSAVTDDVTLLGGLVQLHGLHWTASRTIGATNTGGTQFTFGQVVIGGKPVSGPATPTASPVAAINKALAPLGFTLIEPSETKNQQTGGVTIGPLILRFSGSTLDRTALSPVVGTVIQLETLLQSNSTAGSDCTQIRQLAYNIGTSVDTLLNVMLEISEGAGALDFDFGGATASALEAPDYANPFGTDVTSADLTGTDPASGVDAGGSPLTSIGGPALPTGTGSGTPPVVAAPSTRLSSSSAICRSMNTAGAQHCWRGVAEGAGVGALAIGVVLLAADVYISHRRRPILRRRSLRG